MDDGKVLSSGTICIVGAGGKSLVSGLFTKGVVICNTSFFGSNPGPAASDDDDDL